MNVKARFVQHLIQNQPNLLKHNNQVYIDSIISEQLISPFQVILNKALLKDIIIQIQQYWKLREWGKSNLSEKYPLKSDQPKNKLPKNYSVCMSYDFHVNSSNQLELIEVNTNSAFLALGLELYKFWNIEKPVPTFDETKLIEMFRNEARLNSNSELNKLAICDDNPKEQRLFIEFLLYQALFDSHEIESDILDTKEVNQKKQFDLIYNRSTDFYLKEDSSKNLKQLFTEQQQTLSPNPWEYFLTADKERLLDWNQQTEIEKPSSLLKIYDLGNEDKEKIWSERKSLFIKPKTSFGSKQSYRGGSISRKAFEDVFNHNFIAQQFSQPSEIEVELNNENQKLKYDLRCYAYQDQLQLVVARLYQGQTTNLRTAGGGFACVVFR